MVLQETSQHIFPGVGVGLITVYVTIGAALPWKPRINWLQLQFLSP